MMTKRFATRALMTGAVSTTAALVLMIGLSPANADGHGVCMAFDYNDDGDRYCSQFYTMEEIRAYHVSYRRACENVNVRSPIDVCEASAYLKDGEKTYYFTIKICRKLVGEDEGNVRFMNMLLTKFGLDRFKTTHYEKHPGTCLDNVDRWKVWPWSTSQPPVITTRETWNR